MARRSTNTTQEIAPTGDGETTSAYFRRIFRENPKLLKQGSNADLFERWLKDHPGKKEVPNNIKAILHAVKSRLRQKRRQRRAEQASVAPAALAPTSPVPPAPAVARRVGKGLGQLEEEIDDCLALARGMDRDGLAQVIESLRSARNGVVRQTGG